MRALGGFSISPELPRSKGGASPSGLTGRKVPTGQEERGAAMARLAACAASAPNPPLMGPPLGPPELDKAGEEAEDTRLPVVAGGGDELTEERE